MAIRWYFTIKTREKEVDVRLFAGAGADSGHPLTNYFLRADHIRPTFYSLAIPRPAISIGAGQEKPAYLPAET